MEHVTKDELYHLYMNIDDTCTKEQHDELDRIVDKIAHQLFACSIEEIADENTAKLS